jgi:NAD(P)-dependent dehydrogenase (short-subunit alcohol dehydrogenase family)
MGQAELDGDKGAYLRQMVGGSNAGRLGTLDDIGAAVDFLLSPAAAYISGTDLVVDGGVIAGLRSGHIRMA